MTNTAHKLPTFGQLKKAYLDSGYEIRFFPQHTLERLALDAPADVKRHINTNIMGLIMPDEGVIGIVETLSPEDKTETLIHELSHELYPDLPEDVIEEMTVELAQSLDARQFGFFQFLVS